MKRFKYRLQSLLNVRSHIEKEKQKEHAGALQQVHNQKEQLTDVDHRRTNTLSAQRGLQKDRITLAELLVCIRYLAKLKKDTLVGKELLRGLEKNAEEKRKDLVEASKQRKIYEKLKEKQLERFHKEVKAMETKDADEVANTSFVRSARAR